MTNDSKAEILRVLQEKYGVLKEFQIMEHDHTVYRELIDDTGKRIYGGEFHVFDHAIVLDALWEWMENEPNVNIGTGFDWGFYIQYYLPNAEEGINKLKYLEYESHSAMIWHMTEWILQQKGEL